MISLTEIAWSGPGRPVEGYGPGFFRVGGSVLHGPILVTPEGAARWGGLEDRAALLALAGQVDVILLGMGAEIAWPEAIDRTSPSRPGTSSHRSALVSTTSALMPASRTRAR